MKKFVAIVSILLLLFCHFSAVGEGIDLKSLSVEELSVLSDRITQEMFDRGVIFEEDLPFGKYVVGKDIRAGTYTLEFSNVVPQLRPYVLVFESVDSKHKVLNEGIYADTSVQVTLEDGMLLEIRSGVADVKITNRKSSFAP